MVALVVYVHLQSVLDGELDKAFDDLAPKPKVAPRIDKVKAAAWFLASAFLATSDAGAWADPATAIAVGSVLGGVAAVGTATVGGIKAFSKPKAPSMDKSKSPLVADTGLKPGQKTNLVNTSPQGVLGEPLTGRKTLLGG